MDRLRDLAMDWRYSNELIGLVVRSRWARDSPPVLHASFVEEAPGQAVPTRTSQQQPADQLIVTWEGERAAAIVHYAGSGPVDEWLWHAIGDALALREGVTS